MRILVTGGTGYIGSHTVVELIESGHEPIVVDNLVNSKRSVIDRIETITGKKVTFYELDVCDTDALIQILRKHPCEAVMHFAGLKAVGDSVEKPLLYFKTNIDSTISLIEAVLETVSEERPPRIIFSSSATVYGDPQFLPITEDHPVGQNITNPYGQTKYMCEQILRDIATSNPKAQMIALRYFNPIGAHPSGLIGEDPLGKPNNLSPVILQVLLGLRPHVELFGNDYDTRDGTGVRDYVDVVDLAIGHVLALKYLEKGFLALNLGTGKGTSVTELISIYEKALEFHIPISITSRREGDIAENYASAQNALNIISWTPTKSLQVSCSSSLNWIVRQVNWEKLQMGGRSI